MQANQNKRVRWADETKNQIPGVCNSTGNNAQSVSQSSSTTTNDKLFISDRISSSVRLVGADGITTVNSDIPNFGLIIEFPKDVAQHIYSKFFRDANYNIRSEDLSDCICATVSAISAPTNEYTYIILYFAAKTTFLNAKKLLEYHTGMAQWRDRFHKSGFPDVLETSRDETPTMITIRYKREHNGSSSLRIIRIIYEPFIFSYDVLQKVLNGHNSELKKIMDNEKNPFKK